MKTPKKPKPLIPSVTVRFKVENQKALALIQKAIGDGKKGITADFAAEKYFIYGISQALLAKKKEPVKPFIADKDLPAWLPRHCWYAFLQSRKNIKKPIQTLAMEQHQIDKLAKWNSEGKNVEEILQNAINNGYVGLFIPQPPQTNFTKPYNTPYNTSGIQQQAREIFAQMERGGK